MMSEGSPSDESRESRFRPGGVVGAVLLLAGGLVIVALTGNWPEGWRVRGGEIYPRETPVQSLDQETLRALEWESRARAEWKRVFLPIRDRAWTQAREAWKTAQETEATASDLPEIKIQYRPEDSKAILMAPAHWTRRGTAGANGFPETMIWYLETEVLDIGVESLWLKVILTRSPRPLLLDRVESTIRGLYLEAHLGPATQELDTGPEVVEGYRIQLSREILRIVEKEDVELVLRGDNRVKRKITLFASECHWMLRFLNYELPKHAERIPSMAPKNRAAERQQK